MSHTPTLTLFLSKVHEYTQEVKHKDSELYEFLTKQKQDIESQIAQIVNIADVAEKRKSLRKLLELRLELKDCVKQLAKQCKSESLQLQVDTLVEKYESEKSTSEKDKGVKCVSETHDSETYSYVKFMSEMELELEDDSDEGDDDDENEHNKTKKIKKIKHEEEECIDVDIDDEEYKSYKATYCKKGIFSTKQDELDELEQIRKQHEKELEDEYTRRLDRRLCPERLPPKFVQIDVCPACKRDMVKNSIDAGLKCLHCGTLTSFLNSSMDGAGYGEEQEYPNHVYERIKHFKSFIRQYRLNSQDIPIVVLNALKSELAKFRDVSKHKYSQCRLRTALTKMNLQSFHSCTNILTRMLLNKKCVYFTDEQYSILIERFSMIQRPFELFRGDRTNFINFTFFVRYCIIAEGWNVELLEMFTRLKTQSLIENLDILMNQIGGYLNSKRKNSTDLFWPKSVSL
jgi:hypothetical protein